MCNLGEQIRLHWQWKGWWGNCNERILRRKFVLQVHICLLLFSLPKYSLWHWLWIKFLDFSLVCVPVKCSYVQFLSNWMLLTTLISSWIWTDVMNLNCRWLWKGIFFVCVCWRLWARQWAFTVAWYSRFLLVRALFDLVLQTIPAQDNTGFHGAYW